MIWRFAYKEMERSKVEREQARIKEESNWANVSIFDFRLRLTDFPLPEDQAKKESDGLYNKMPNSNLYVNSFNYIAGNDSGKIPQIAPSGNLSHILKQVQEAKRTGFEKWRGLFILLKEHSNFPDSGNQAAFI
jgi:hypothetical protein